MGATEPHVTPPEVGEGRLSTQRQSRAHGATRHSSRMEMDAPGSTGAFVETQESPDPPATFIFVPDDPDPEIEPISTASPEPGENREHTAAQVRAIPERRAADTRSVPDAQDNALTPELQAANDRLARTMAGQAVSTLLPRGRSGGGLLPLLIDAGRQDPARFATEYEDLMARYRHYLGPARQSEFASFRGEADAALLRAGFDAAVAPSSPADGEETAGEPDPAVGGQVGVGDVLSTDQMLAWMRQRPGEDPGEWRIRTANAQAELSEALGRDFQTDAQENYEALAAETGLSVTRDHGSLDVMLAGPDGTPLFTADPLGMARLADAMTDDRDIVGLVQGIHDGGVTLADVQVRLEVLEALPTGTSARYARRHGEPTLTRDLRAERDRLRIAHEALLARADGATPEEVGDILIAGFAPDPAADRQAAVALALDLLPVTGEIRSGMEAAAEFSTLRERLEADDLEGAMQAGLLGALATFGAVPGVGTLVRAARRLATRAIRAVPGANTHIARLQAAQFRRQQDIRRPGFLMEKINPHINESNRTNMHILLIRIMRDASENTVRRVLRDGGFDVLKGNGYSGVRGPNQKYMGRILDGSTHQGIRNIRELYLSPDSSTPMGTGIEIKFGGSRYGGSQRAKDDIIRARGGATVRPANKGGFGIDNVEVFRLFIHQVPEEELRSIATHHLETAVSRDLVTQEGANRILDIIMEAREQSARDNPVTLSSIIALLRNAISPQSVAD